MQLRKTKINELPQFCNILAGQMSLIGPRPDYYVHALEYLKNVEGYSDRHTIRPGITGLSQIRLGYAEGLKATADKVNVDNYYIQKIKGHKKMFEVAMYIFLGFSFYLLIKRSPHRSKEMLSQASNIVKYLINPFSLL